VTNEERIELLDRVASSQRTIRALIEIVDEQAAVMAAAGEPGTAFSIYMIRESLAVYSSQLSRYLRKHLEKN